MGFFGKRSGGSPPSSSRSVSSKRSSSSRRSKRSTGTAKKKRGLFRGKREKSIDDAVGVNNASEVSLDSDFERSLENDVQTLGDDAAKESRDAPPAIEYCPSYDSRCKKNEREWDGDHYDEDGTLINAMMDAIGLNMCQEFWLNLDGTNEYVTDVIFPVPTCGCASDCRDEEQHHHKARGDGSASRGGGSTAQTGRQQASVADGGSTVNSRSRQSSTIDGGGSVGGVSSVGMSSTTPRRQPPPQQQYRIAQQRESPPPSQPYAFGKKKSSSFRRRSFRRQRSGGLGYLDMNMPVKFIA